MSKKEKGYQKSLRKKSWIELVLFGTRLTRIVFQETRGRTRKSDWRIITKKKKLIRKKKEKKDKEKTNFLSLRFSRNRSSLTFSIQLERSKKRFLAIRS
jgi:hypothetical protein